MEYNRLIGKYSIQCINYKGDIIWNDTANNMVVNQGKNSLLNSYFQGTAYVATWCCSLITAGTVQDTSTYSSPTVTEVTNQIIANRQTMTWVTASGGSKSSNVISFPIIGSAIITGN